jgi:hypothetical protein
MQAATPIDIADFLAGLPKEKKDPTFKADALYVVRQAILNALYLKILQDQLYKQGIPKESIHGMMQAATAGLSLKVSYKDKPI